MATFDKKHKDAWLLSIKNTRMHGYFRYSHFVCETPTCTAEGKEATEAEASAHKREGLVTQHAH